MSSFNSGQFERELKKAVEKTANEGMKKVGVSLQRALDGVYRTHQGKPPSEIEAALVSALRRADFTPDAGQIKSWAKAISDGTRVKVDVQRVRL